MSKELILVNDVEGLGIVGDVVTVSEGHARNFLLPKKLAAPVTEIMKKRLAKARAKREEELADELQKAKRFAKKIEESSCTIPTRVNDEGHLYGSIKTSDIIEALKQQKINLDKKQVHIDNPIRELGVFTVTLILHPQVKTTLKVWVVEE